MIKQKTKDKIDSRIKKLTPDTLGLWGKMNATQMLGHLTDSIKVAIGEIKVKSRYKFPNYWIFLYAIYILPVSLWKKSLKTPKEIDQLKSMSDPKDFDSQVREFKKVLEKFDVCDASLISEHPLFGKLSKRETKDFLLKHIDYHFRQFGI